MLSENIFSYNNSYSIVIFCIKFFMKKKLKMLFVIISVCLIVSFILVCFIGKRFNNSIKEYSLIEAERFGIYIINASVDKMFINELEKDIFNIHKNSNGEIQLVEIDAKETNILLENVTTKIQQNLLDLENGNIQNFDLSDSLQGVTFSKIKKGVVFEISQGMIFKNSLLSNIGPVIPIKMNFIGQVTSSIKSSIKSYGINNVYVELYIHIEIKQRVTMPLRTEDIIVDSDIPLAIQVIQGQIPNYYQNPIINESSQFSVPLS